MIAHRVEENGAPLTINDLPAHPQFRESAWLQHHRFWSCLAAPLVINGRIFGGLTFYSSGKRLFTERDVAFVMGLASEAAIAVYNSQLYERTTKQAAELEIANRVKDEFLSVMSHELRTPINVIQGYLTLIQERVLGEINPDQEQALVTIAVHSKVLLTMVERIMDVMNIENGAIVTELNEVSVPALLDDLKSQYSDPLDKEIELIWEYVPDLPILHTDAPKLKRILQDLVDNAIKFTERGRVVVAAKLSRETESLSFEVTDTGIGIAPHALPLIFQKFRQADSSATRRHEGVGLGLYIVKRLADLIGAKIEVKSRLGAGTTFTVVFPPVEPVSGEPPMADERSHDQNARMRA
jgi:signal transduction histidine kinase